MKLSSIRTAIRFEFWFTPLTSDTTVAEQLRGSIGKDGSLLCRIESGPVESYNLLIQKNIIGVKLRDKKGGQDLDFHLNRGCAHLGEMTAVAQETDGQYSFSVTLSFFAGSRVELEDVCVGVDEKIMDTGKKNGISVPTIGDFCALLQNRCTLADGNDVYFFMLAGAAADDDFKATGEGDVESTAPHAFAICGDQVTIPVERRSMGEDREAFFATKVTFKKLKKGEAALRLVHAALRFVDFTRSGEESEIKLLAQAALRTLNDEPGTYLKVWDEYAAKEGDLLLEKARAIGELHVINSKSKKFFLKESVESVPEILKAGDSLEAVKERPLFLRKDVTNWASYQAAIAEEAANKTGKTKKNSGPAYTVKGTGERSITVNQDDLLPDGHFLVLSITGDKTQLDRQQKARKAIMEGRCANPTLGLLIADGGVPPTLRGKTQIAPLSAFVEKKIFQTPPTLRQKEAIEMALNTPDFALIQGPPGTGKTTVINAIVERLNELYEKKDGLRGKVWVGAFQHDAVENLTSRLRINGIPAVKLGKRSGDAENISLTEQAQDEWCAELRDKIKTTHRGLEILQKSVEQQKLQSLFTLYTQSPGSAAALEILDFILGLSRTVVSDDCVAEARVIKQNLQEEKLPQDHETLRLIRSLRISAEGFSDDGPDRALEVLMALEGQGNNALFQEATPLLTQGTRWKPGNDLSFLKNLRELRRKLLLAYTPAIHLHREKPREDMVKLIGEIQKQLERNQSSGDKKGLALASFLNELENNPDGIEEALSDYSLVFASTVQFTGGDVMAKQKTDTQNSAVIFDTVIIDEAARVSPLDLLIPLSQAEKRIILVGDHRQLPQIIDDHIVEEVLSGEEEADHAAYRKAYEESMFGYLVNRLEKLTAHDHIKRVITLDKQYRMHPLLGNFVSNQFYRKYGDKEAFDSPRPASDFPQNLPKVAGKAAVWMDVPLGLGGHERHGTGWVREAEAKRIAGQLQEWIDCPEGRDLTFGVISFYRDQVNLIKEKLLKSGLTEKDDHGEHSVSKNYAARLRIGTVDSFQGMEFDVVLLSMVRSCQIHNGPINEKQKRAVFGFLLSENRQCVAMSRQKRLLVAAGDGALAQSGLAREAVPAFPAFYELCKDEGALL